MVGRIPVGSLTVPVRAVATVVVRVSVGFLTVPVGAAAAVGRGRRSYENEDGCERDQAPDEKPGRPVRERSHPGTP